MVPPSSLLIDKNLPPENYPPTEALPVRPATKLQYPLVQAIWKLYARLRTFLYFIPKVRANLVKLASSEARKLANAVHRSVLLSEHYIPLRTKQPNRLILLLLSQLPDRSYLRNRQSSFRAPFFAPAYRFSLKLIPKVANESIPRFLYTLGPTLSLRYTPLYTVDIIHVSYLQLDVLFLLHSNKCGNDDLQPRPLAADFTSIRRVNGVPLARVFTNIFPFPLFPQYTLAREIERLTLFGKHLLSVLILPKFSESKMLVLAQAANVPHPGVQPGAEKLFVKSVQPTKES